MERLNCAIAAFYGSSVLDLPSEQPEMHFLNDDAMIRTKRP
jgi:hypothetical protein